MNRHFPDEPLDLWEFRRSCVLSDWDLRGTDLRDTNLSNVNLDGATWSNGRKCGPGSIGICKQARSSVGSGYCRVAGGGASCR